MKNTIFNFQSELNKSVDWSVAHAPFEVELADASSAVSSLREMLNRELEGLTLDSRLTVTVLFRYAMAFHELHRGKVFTRVSISERSAILDSCIIIQKSINQNPTYWAFGYYLRDIFLEKRASNFSMPIYVAKSLDCRKVEGVDDKNFAILVEVISAILLGRMMARVCKQPRVLPLSPEGENIDSHDAGYGGLA